MGAKRAKDLIPNPGEVNNPFLTDIRILGYSDGEYCILRQPFLSQWTRLYEIAWDEHRGLAHAGCECCEVFKEIPLRLRCQAFTWSLLEEDSEYRPNFDEVEDLVSKC